MAASTLLLATMGYVLLSAPQVMGAALDGANAADFAVLCDLERLASASIAEAYSKITIPTTAVDEINQIVAATTNAENITNVPDGDLQDDNAAAEGSCKNQTQSTAECKDHWLKWRAIKEAVKEQTPRRYPEIPSAARTNALARPFQAAIHKLAKEAAIEHTRLVQQASEQADPDKCPANTKLSNALYGQNLKALTGGADTGHTPGANRAAGCKEPNTGKSLVTDMFCLCMADSTSSARQPCGFASTGCHTGTWEDCDLNGKKAAWQVLQQKCQQRPKKPLSAANIRMDLAAFTSRLKQDATRDIGTQATIYLGQSDSNACGAHDGKLCIDYSNAFKDAGRAAGIYWYNELAAAAVDLEQLAEAQADLQLGIRTLEDLARQARQLYRMITALPPPSPNNSNKAQAQAEINTKGEKAEKVCNEALDAAACSKLKEQGCHFVFTNDKGKKCTLSEEGKQAAAKAEERNKAGKKCSYCAKREECEAENSGLGRGEKPKCGWIEDKCKDFSTLVNKKLTLLAAAFVSFSALRVRKLNVFFTNL
uniref:Variant surface glycoprotein n=1 Tax=Trypanosoma brucei TaxID=5691 RepID=A0A1V0FYI6_9TRYP|nr:variant surface glycoprotein [Trypanosoma brucei]